MNRSKLSTRYIATVGMFSALAFASVLLAKVIPNVAGFLSYEPKDALIAIAGFIYGPMTACLITVIVSFIEMITISGTGMYGFLMNVLATWCFVVPAVWYYKKAHTYRGAVLGLGFGVGLMTAGMLLWNYIITPFYMGVDRSDVAAMLLPIFLPFNLVKGGINAGLKLLVYKPVVSALRRAGLVEPSRSESSAPKKKQTGFTLFAAVVFISFLLFFLVLAGIL